ncbi:hypothetical protein DFR79_101161 [Halanaerobium saccharolyticum]|uniref:Uncharacterized protein n=1 Tax=Halanaerobium saccharolyticum TaxID=43595 RepID=A0A4V3CFU6_9FIRM|nr:hypothetical protein [Halanaerobium saccharolyticum]TDO95162.1 hypothetical protein DFR79_101161 [Halanaerobium saccharolyticum]
MEQDFLDSMRQIIKEEISPLEEKLDKNTEAISSIEVKLDENTEAIASIETKVDKNTEAIASIGTKVDENTEAIASIETKVDENTGGLNSVSRQLEENTLILKALEENKDYRNNQMDKLINDVAEIQGSIKHLEESFNNHSHEVKTEIGKVKVS